MEIGLFILVPVSIGMGLVGLAAFVWSVRHDQFDDPEGAAWRVLAADAGPGIPGRGAGDASPLPQAADRSAEPGAVEWQRYAP